MAKGDSRVYRLFGLAARTPQRRQQRLDSCTTDALAHEVPSDPSSDAMLPGRLRQGRSAAIETGAAAGRETCRTRELTAFPAEAHCQCPLVSDYIYLKFCILHAFVLRNVIKKINVGPDLQISK